MTLDELMAKWQAEQEQVEYLQKQAEEHKQKAGELAKEIKQLVEGSQFEHEGKTYQIRKRAGRYYMCHMVKKAGKKKKDE